MQSLSLKTAPPPDRRVEQQDSWKSELAAAISSPAELLHELDLDHLAENVLQDASFRLRVPRAYLSKMQKGDASDPLLLQVLPMLQELEESGLMDPVGDLNALTTPGLLHKYHGRALLISTAACAVHCRYCFRRHYPYADAGSQVSNWQNTLNYLQSHTEIHEVILSGGDPLVLDDIKLEQLCTDLESIKHIKWLRLHTRLPVVLPSRINHSLLNWLNNTRFRTTVVIHCNHANELGEAERTALQGLRQAGATLLNQSVLLRGINDDARSLIELSHRLHDFGVLPYYLHMLDRVQGAMHFEVEQDAACEMMHQMRSSLPGFLVPRLVREESGAASKTAIFSI